MSTFCMFPFFIRDPLKDEDEVKVYYKKNQHNFIGPTSKNFETTQITQSLI